MASELPYFRFKVSEWMNGDISMEDYECKGLFIDVCAWYWFKDCSITKAMLERRYNNARLLQILYESDVIKFDEDIVVIEFLNEQFDILTESRKARQDAGRKGGLSKAKAKLKQSSSYKDKDKDKDKKYMSEISEKEITDKKPYLKIAYEFWLMFRKYLINNKVKTKIIEKDKENRSN